MFLTDSIQTPAPTPVVDVPEPVVAPATPEHPSATENTEADDVAASVGAEVADDVEEQQNATLKQTVAVEKPAPTVATETYEVVEEYEEGLAAVDSLLIVDETVAVPGQPIPPAWERGLEPIERPGHSGHSQGIISMIVIIMLCLCLFFKNIRRVWGSLKKNLFNPRVEQPLEHNTEVEKRTIFFLIGVTVIFLALLTSAGLARLMPWVFKFDMSTTLKMMALVAGYFVFQYTAYEVVGFAFSNDEGRRKWVDGFTASMTVLGLGLLLPGLVVLFYPAVTMIAVYFAILLYILARFAFICKGFRIFYTNSVSIVYFILYLCSLEIVPVTIFFYLARILCSF